MALDPLVASDLGYAVKTWMATMPAIACRPWNATTLRDGIRIVGWRREPPSQHNNGVYAGARPMTLEAGQKLALAGSLVALRRVKSRGHDAARGRSNPKAAYEAWLRERLIEIMPSAAIDRVDIESFRHQRVLRKVSRDKGAARVREEVIPVVQALVVLRVLAPAAVEDWLINGCGPQKAFGYGGFFPVLDPGAGEP